MTVKRTDTVKPKTMVEWKNTDRETRTVDAFA